MEQHDEQYRNGSEPFDIGAEPTIVRRRARFIG